MDMEREELIAKLEELRPQIAERMRSQGAHEPDWRPLEKKVPPQWCSGFMFMGYAGHIRMYKHGITRRYLNLDPGGNAYRYDAKNDRYHRIPLKRAFDHVFDGLKEMGYTRETPYDDEFIRRKHEALAAAGWTIVGVGPEDLAEPPKS